MLLEAQDGVKFFLDLEADLRRELALVMRHQSADPGVLFRKGDIPGEASTNSSGA